MLAGGVKPLTLCPTYPISPPAKISQVELILKRMRTTALRIASAIVVESTRAYTGVERGCSANAGLHPRSADAVTRKPSTTVLCAVKRRWSTAGRVPLGNWFAPPDSNRSGGGGNQAAGASGAEGRYGDLASMQAVT